MQVLTYDIETTYGKYLKRVGSPWCPDFHVCSIGWKADEADVESSYHVREVDGENTGGHLVTESGFLTALKETEWLVGANIKFDNLWFWESIRPELARGMKVWDVLYAHYLLTGQLYNLSRPEHMRPSLNAVAAYYDLPTKIDKVKHLWDAEVRTEDIDEDLLIEYQEYDVVLTEMIFRLQVKQLLQQGRFNQVFQRMEGLLATTEMEYNGLKIDMEKARELQAALEAEYDSLGVELEKNLPKFPPELEFNWGSPAHVSAIIFGGDIKYEKWVQHRDENDMPLFCQKTIKVPLLDADGNHVRYKSGKQKGDLRYKNETVPDFDKPKGCKTDFWFTCERKVRPLEKWKTKIPGRYSTAAEVLEVLQGHNGAFIKNFTRWKAIDKDLGTYYERDGKGMLTLVGEDGCIHHNLNHTMTVTSRLSSSAPNLQNIPSGRKSDIKSVFVSRYLNGVLGEIDYSQLEVVTKAVLSGDVNLRHDLLAGVDFHCMNLALSLGEDYDNVWHLCHVVEDIKYCNLRQDIKAFTFQDKYGASASKMAESTGMTEDQIKKLMAAKAKKYPQEAAFDEMVADEVNNSKIPTRLKSEPSKFPLSAGYYKCVTGTWYSFLEEEAPEFNQRRGIFTSIKPTILKNYPSQGLGGEIMQIQLGRVFRWLIRSEYDNDVKLVNTVHDCCWVDFRSLDIAKLVAPMIAGILEDVSDYWLEKFDVNWYDMPFPVETEVGPNMLDLHKL